MTPIHWSVRQHNTLWIENHTQSTDHSNNEPAFSLLRVFTYLNLAALNGRVFVFFAGPSFEDREECLFLISGLPKM